MAFAISLPMTEGRLRRSLVCKSFARTIGEFRVYHERAHLRMQIWRQTLTKIIDGKPAISDTLTNEQTVKCPRCEQTYRLGFSDDEWHRVKDWLKLADTAIRNDHDSRHEAPTIALEWPYGGGR